MRRMKMSAPLVVVLVVVAVAGCGGEDEGPGSSPGGPTTAELTFVYKADESAGPERATLTCPAAQDDSAGKESCLELGRVPTETFDPVPPGTACTEIYGGPQTVRVTGRLGGREIESLFSRVNGCEISRWDSLSPVLESLGLERVGAALPR